MEEMNREIMDVIDQMINMPKYLKTKAGGEAEEDRYGYPFEPVDAFSGEPLGLSETGLRLQFEAMELFNMAARANRHSPLFYKMSGQLEKLIGQLGSICITKAVLEQQGEQFETLDRLKISLLRSMTANNFRKSWTSFMESRAANAYNAEALDLSIRWAALDRRLIATDEKIRKIQSGEIRIDTSVKNTVSENRKQPEKASEKEKPARPFDPQARAFPVDKAAVREMNEQTAAAQPEEAASAEPETAEGIPAFTDLPDFEDDPANGDEWADDAEEDAPEEWPFPIPAGFMSAQDRDLYRVDTSSLPQLIREKWPP